MMSARLSHETKDEECDGWPLPPPVGSQSLFTPHCPDAQEYVVDFDGPDDILNPQNWPTWTK